MPGHAGAAGEVLAQGEPEPARERRGRSRRRSGVLLLLAGLLLGGASVAVDRGERPEPAPLPVAPEGFPGLSAGSRLVSQERLRVRLLVEVRIAAESATTGLPGSSASAAQVRLQGITAPGLVVRLPDRPPPVPLGYVGRFGSGLEQVVRLTVDVVALGCAEPERPRRLALAVRRSTASGDRDGVVVVQDRAEVTQALEVLVRRSCRGAGR